MRGLPVLGSGQMRVLTAVRSLGRNAYVSAIAEEAEMPQGGTSTTLSRLERRGLVMSEERFGGGKLRRYYAVTEAGKRMMTESTGAAGCE